MDKQIRDISKKRTWKKILRRSVALLCAVVMLFTMNTLKRNADTLEHIPMCGYAEHVHSASCFSGDVLVCGMEEHIHTDACYQESPTDEGMDDLAIEVDDPIVDDTVEELDLSLALDDLDLVTEDVAAQPVSNAPQRWVYNLGTGATVSQIIEAVGLNVGLDEIKEAGAVENDEAHSGLITVEKDDGDYRVWAKKDFDEAELALILADDILVVELRDGVAQEEDITPAEQPAIEDAPDEQTEEGEQPAIEDVPDVRTGDDEAVELPVIEDEAPVEGQAEETVLVEDVSPDVDEQTDTVEQPSIDDEPDERAEDTAIAEQLAHEGEALAEDAGTEVSVPVEEESDETASLEDAVPVGDDTVIAEDEGAGETVSIEEEEQVEEQPAEEAAEEQGEDQPAEEETTEEQGEDQPAEVAGGEQGEEQPAEEAAGEQGEDQPVEEAAGEQGEDQPAEEAAGELGEEQPADEAAGEQGEEQPAEEAVEAQDQDQPAEEAAGEQDEEQPAEEATGEQGEEQPAGEETAESQDEEQPAGEATGEQGEEQPAEEAIEEQGEEQPAEEPVEAQDQEQPAEGEGEEQPAEEAADEQGEEQPAEEAIEEQGEEQPAEEVADEQGEEQPAGEEITEEQGDEQPAGEETTEAPVYTATIDLAEVETYPLSLNAMLTAAEPAQEEEQAEQDEAAQEAEQQPADAFMPTIEYDEALLSIVESDGDWLVTPIQSFESTQITVTNGSVYALTLVNCALPEAAEAQPEASYPAQAFEERTDYVKVSVTAPEGAFPEGTTMTVTDVEDEKTLNDIQDTVTEGFVEVERVHAVDIVFSDAEGNEIEPLVPISVVMTVAEIAQEEEAVLVHVDDTGATEVVESQTGAPAGETEIAAEMPAVEAQRPDSGEEAPRSDEEAPQMDGEAADDETAVGFESDSFSVYAVVVTRTIETKYIDAEGETWNISVGYGPEAEIPAGAMLRVEEVEEAQYLSEAEAAIEGGKRVTMARFFDISILDAEGVAVQPKVPVTVSVQLADGSEGAPQAFHFTESGLEAVETQKEEGTVVFEAESFSIYGILFTADFSSDEYAWRLTGNGQIYLSDLLEALAIDRKAVEATGIVCSRPELFDIEQTESDWLLTSLMSFEGEESLTVEFRDGNIVVIRMRDAAVRAKAGERVAQCGDATITATYTEAAGLPADVAFRAKEILPGTELYDASLNAALNKLETESGRGIDLSLVRFFDLEFSLDGVEVEPLAPVQVNIRYAEPEAPTAAEGESEVQTSVVHFANDTGVSVQEAMLQRAEAAERAETGGDVLSSEGTSEDGLYSVEAIEDGLPPVEADGGEADDVPAGEVAEAVSAADNAEILEADVRLGDGGELLELTYAQASFSVAGTLQYYYSANTIVVDGVRYEKIKISELEDGQKYVLFYSEGGRHYVLNRGLNSDTRQKYELSSGITYDVSAQWTLNIVNDNGTKRYKLSNTDNNEGTAYANPANGTWCQTSEAYCAFDITDNGYAAKLKAENDTRYIQRHPTDSFYVGYSNSGTSFYFIKPGYDVWFDGSNGVYRGSHLHTANNKTYIMYDHGNTLYTYIDNANRVNYVKNYYESPSFEKHAIAPYGTNSEVVLPKLNDAEICRPYAYTDNHFQLQGWYCINTGDYYPLDPNNGDVRAQVKQDSTFYADWFPDTYDIGQNSNVFQTTDTSKFISTHMFDYNNLFNMRSLKLDSDISHYSAYGNYDFWREKTDSLDFLFIHKGAMDGTTIQPPDRGDRNSSNELNVNGNFYTGRVKTGMLTSALKDALFSHGNDIGKRYVGSANYLYKYDEATGYYYYDSDLHAAAYNHSAGRFYVYNNTIATDKSDSGDKTDFLPYNYGKDRYVEGYDEVNYWFGMESQINFFLPNATGYTDSQGVTGNRSVKGDEMVYKFSGDDDVWVLVDGQVVLDMGGVHGKVYGEINFSRGTWTVVESTANTAAPITRDESKLLAHEDHKGIIGYGDGGHVITGTLNLAEGDHTLTLYYLERGSSQSNCAIYFNLAPRYALQFHKVDASDPTKNLGGATFGVYTDPECTVAANVWGTYTGARTNIFTTGESGYVHCSGLVAGKTYYIKELSAPSGYPDVSEEVITLQLDACGVPTVSSSEDSSAWTMAGIRSSEAEDSTEKGTFMLYMTVKNRKETDISAQKIWAMIDGSQYSRDENCNVTVKLQRYSLTEGAGEEKKYNVRLIQRYFADGDKPTNRDTAGKLVYDIHTQEVSKGGSITFTASAGNGAGIASVTSQHGIVAASNTSGTGSQHFYMNGGWSEATQSGTYTLSNVQSDTDVYITYIGDTDLPEYLGMSIADISMTGGDGTRYVRTEDAAFNAQSEVNGQPMEVTLSKINGWKATWTNLETVANNIQYYYYVKEISNSSELSGNPLLSEVPAYVTTYSSDGLSGGGTISVRNTLQAVKVKLRKRDSDDNGNVQGVEFKLYTQNEYEAQGYRGTQQSVIEQNVGAWLEGASTYNPTKKVFVSDEKGRFYTGYLPLGIYYIVETGGYAGYEPLLNPVMVRISENGLEYKSNPQDSNWTRRRIDSEGYYNLYINNTRKYKTLEVPASVTVNKVDDSGAALFGATFTLYAANADGSLGDPIKTYTGGSFAVSTDDVIAGEGDSATCLKDLLEGTDSVTLYLKETTAPVGYRGSDEVYTITMSRTVTGPEREPAEDAFVTRTTYAMTIDAGASKDVPNTPVPGDLELTKRLNGEGADASKQFVFTVTLTLPRPAAEETTYLTAVNGTAAEPVTVAAGETEASANITLTRDQTWKINDLPAGTTYVITESDYSAEGYTPSVTGGTLTGAIRGKTVEKESVEVTNIYSPGGLTVEKTLSGNAVDANRAFNFRVNLNGANLSGRYGSYKVGTGTAIGIDFVDGAAEITFALKGGESAAFTHVPAGTAYKVEEISADLDGYETTVTSTGGTVNSDKTVTGTIGSDIIEVSCVNGKNTTVLTATKAWKSGTQTIDWPENVASVEFTLYRKVNGVTAIVSATDAPGIVNPAEVSASTAGRKASWASLPTRCLVDGTWYDAVYSVEETKVTYTDGTELTKPEDITAAFRPAVDNGTFTNNIPRVDIDVTKRWTNPTTPPADTEVAVVLSATANNVPYTLPGVKTEIKLNGDTSMADDTETAWYYQWTELPRYDNDGHLIAYTVAETAVTYEGVTYTVTGDITLEDVFQVSTTQPTDANGNHADIYNSLYETDIHVLKQNAETKAGLPGATFTLVRMEGTTPSTTWPSRSEESEADGTLSFQNLPAGIYRLEETGIPAGYARTSSGKYIYFKIAEGVVDWDDAPDNAIKKANDGVGYSTDETTFTVDNTHGVSLPSTGGPGTTIIYAAGIGLIAMALFGLMLRRRKAHDVIE